MKKLIVWLAILLPLIGSAQVSAPTQKIVSTNIIRSNAGSSGLDTLLVTNGPGVNGYVPVYNTTLKKAVFTAPSAFGTPVSFAPFGSTPNANGASVTSNVITLQPSDATNPGGNSLTAQTYVGDKSFTGNTTFGTPSAATTGLIRLPNNQSIVWRNGTNSGNLGMTFNASDVLQVGGIGISAGSLTSSTIGTGVIVKTNGSGTLIAAASNTDYLPVASPAMTGTPTAPTATGGTNTTQIATTAFVTAAVSGVTSPWTKIGTNLSPTTANDAVVISSSTAGNTVSSTNTAAGGAAFYGSSSNGGATAQFDNSGADPTLILKNTSSGQIARFDNATTQSSINNNGSFNWTGATASTDAVFDASKNLISNAITGTGNGVRATSPTLVTPNIGVATGTSLVTTGGRLETNNVVVASEWTPLFTGATGKRVEVFYNTSGSGQINSYDRTNSVFLPLTLAGSSYILNGLGSGAVQSTAGVLSVVSDSKVKDKHGEFKGSALEAIAKLPKPGYWNYNSKSGFPIEAQKVNQFGAYAEDVHKVLGEEFAPTQPIKIDGKESYGLSDRALLSLALQALSEIKLELELLKSK